MGYTFGDTVTLEVTMSDPDTGAALDANDIACTVKPPTGAEATPAVTKFADGRYRAFFTSTVDGEHWYAFSSATLAMRKEGAFVVDPRHVT